MSSGLRFHLYNLDTNKRDHQCRLTQINTGDGNKDIGSCTHRHNGGHNLARMAKALNTLQLIKTDTLHDLCTAYAKQGLCFKTLPVVATG